MEIINCLLETKKDIFGNEVPINITISGNFIVNGKEQKKLRCPVYRDKKRYYFIVFGKEWDIDDFNVKEVI